MEFNKENLKNEFIPSLFYGKDGKNILKVAQEYFKNNDLSINKITEKFDSSSEDFKYELFWKDLINIINGCYRSKLDVSDYDLNTNFDKLIYSLLKVKFDFEFDPKESKKISNKEALDRFLEKIKQGEGVIDIKSSDNIQRVILPYEKNYYANVNPNSPKKLKEYPNIFIKIKEDRIFLDCSSYKRLSGFINNIQSAGEGQEKTLSEINHNNFEKLDVDVKNLFTNLKEEGFFPTQIRFNSPTFYFNTGSKLIIDYEKLIDSDFYLNSILDFINIEQLKLIYNENVNGKSKDFIVTIKAKCQDLDSSIKIIKYSIKFNNSKNLTPEIKKKILKKLKTIGLEDECSYDLPAEYYVNKLLHSSGDLKKIYNRILELDKENIIINKLSEHKVINISGEDIKVDLEKLSQVLLESFAKLKNLNYNADQEQFVISRSFIDDKGRLSLDFKLFDDEKRINQFYQAIIYDDVRDYDKILKIVIYNLDQAFVINNLFHDKKNEVLQYLYLKIKNYLNYEYNLQLEKESISAHRYLEDYSKKFSEWEKEKDAKILGGIVEKKLNILLKYLYRNYKPLGGPRKPDGYLFINNNGRYLFDSKQHKNIYQGEIDKIARYLFTFDSEELEGAKEGVLIICRGKLGKTLNKLAIDEWKKSDYFSKEYSISFLSLEFILKIYELIKKPQTHIDLRIKQKILDSLLSILNKSKSISKKETLINLENKTLENLEKIIDEEKSISKKEGGL